MKQEKLITRSLLCFLLGLFSVVSFAQEKTIDVNINTKGESGGFFSSPWVWVVGGAVFILLLVALLRGGGSKS